MDTKELTEKGFNKLNFLVNGVGGLHVLDEDTIKGFIKAVYKNGDELDLELFERLARQHNWRDTAIEEVDRVFIKDPYLENRTYLLRINHTHVDLLKKHKARGKSIVVWSAGGYEWALAVVKALELETFVNLVMAKPTAYVDDLPCQEFMNNRVYVSTK